MPSQLLDRLKRFFDQGIVPAGPNPTHPLDQVMAHKPLPNANLADTLGNPPTQQDPAKPNRPGVNIAKHWASTNWGSKMVKNTVTTSGANNVSGVNTIVIHETSGFPAHSSAQNMVNAFLCLSDETEWIEAKAAVPPVQASPGPPPVAAKPGKPAVPAHWFTNMGARGIGPQYYIDGNGTVFALIGEHDLSDEPYITWHSGGINGTSIGIENGDVGDAKNIRPGNTAGTVETSPHPDFWFRLSTTAQTEDMPGMSVFALVLPQSADPDLGLIWFATAAKGAAIPAYAGSGDTTQITSRYSNWDNMIFTERDYRSLALLCRLLTEQYGIPRNFCVLPYAKLSGDTSNSTILRKLILADERQDMMARKFGVTIADIQNTASSFGTAGAAKVATLWRSFFGFKSVWSTNLNRYVESALLPTYRGLLAHVMAGDHPCPGPLFDWHRFAREVWDWWWYPFDLNIAVPALVSPRRGYTNARGDTLLQEYYYDAAEAGTDFTTIGARFNALASADLDASAGVSHFGLDAGTPAYAMANGVIVAARLPNPQDVANPAFLLVRHELFYRADATTNAIDYDHPPTIAWTLTTYLACDQFDYTQPSDNNPEWLNRLLVRLKECELAVAYKTAHPADNAQSTQYKGHPKSFANDQLFQQAWSHVPTSGAPQRLSTGTEIQADATAYRDIVTTLQANNYKLFPLEGSSDTTPVRVILGDFIGTCGSFPNPPMGSQGSNGIRVQIFSKDVFPVPQPPQKAALSCASETWWRDVTATTRLDLIPERGLPADGLVYSYNLTDFLDWINRITWLSEWRKYEVVDATGAPVPAPVRPRTRLGL
jgi:hypothetical protein